MFVTISFVSCNKSNDATNNASIDVSAQWQIDALGNLILGLPDGQWQSKTFSTAELNLFTSLDTANLNGTATPTAVLENNNLRHNSIYPNPFTSTFYIQFGFTPGYSGQFVFKSVIVDSLMNPVDKKVVRMQATVFGPGNVSNSNAVGFASSLTVGRYRLYYTLSSQANPHFYKSWGNIQRN